MNVFAELKELVGRTAADVLGLKNEPPNFKVTATEPRHGQATTNLAMVLAAASQQPPRQTAEKIAIGLRAAKRVKTAEVAGPGFINLVMDDEFWHRFVGEILRRGENWGEVDLGRGESVIVEYVSANPTGPMHIGHARGAVVGDVLAALLEKAGFAVTREYYINDGGAQIEKLAASLYARYLRASGRQAEPLPADGYHGDYLIAVAEALRKKDGDKWLDKPRTQWLKPFATTATAAMMELIKSELLRLGVRHKTFTSEAAIAGGGGIEKAIATLEKKGLIYEGILQAPKGGNGNKGSDQPQLLFKTTDFGDELDRPLKRTDGSWSYFAPDIAYHLKKYQDGFSKMVNVWGVDHFGYVKRLQAATAALTDGKADLKMLLVALVNLKRDGKTVKMSKRRGDFVTLSEVVDEVGKDAVRFIMLTRRNDMPLDFDFAKAVEKSMDNPCFYVQYAHTRCCSVLNAAAREGFAAHEEKADPALLNQAEEQRLIQLLAEWPERVAAAAAALEPHRIASYLIELAAAFHELWSKGNKNARLRFITDNKRQTAARLALVQATRYVLCSGLKLVGVTPAKEM